MKRTLKVILAALALCALISAAMAQGKDGGAKGGKGTTSRPMSDGSGGV